MDVNAVHEFPSHAMVTGRRATVQQDHIDPTTLGVYEWHQTMLFLGKSPGFLRYSRDPRAGNRVVNAGTGTGTTASRPGITRYGDVVRTHRELPAGVALGAISPAWAAAGLAPQLYGFLGSLPRRAPPPGPAF